MLDLQRMAGNQAVGKLIQHGHGIVVQRQVMGGPGAAGPLPMLRPPAMPLESMPPSVWELPPITGGGAARAAERVAVDTAVGQAERVAAEEVAVQVGERIVSRRVLAGIAAVALADEWNPVGWFLDGVLIGLLVIDAIEGYRELRTTAETRPAQSPPSAQAPGVSSGVRVVDPVPIRSINAPPARPSTPAQAPGTSGTPVNEPGTVTPLEAARRSDPELDRLIDQAVTLQLEVGAVAAVSGVLVTAVSRGGPRTVSRQDQASSPMINSIETLMRDANLLDPARPDLPYHAEKKMVVQWGGPFAVNCEICPNCWRFLRYASATMGRRIIVADPAGVYAIRPNGSVLSGPLVVRVPASR